MNGKKISKSDGNVAFMSEVRERGFEGADVRMFFLMAHYKSFQDFSREALENAKKARMKLKKKLSPIDPLDLVNPLDPIDMELIERALELLADDMDTPKMLARLFAVVDSMDANDEELRSAIYRLDQHILWLDLFSPITQEQAPEEVIDLAARRRAAKLSKDRTTADTLRDEIQSLGRKMLDGKDGYELEKI